MTNSSADKSHDKTASLKPIQDQIGRLGDEANKISIAPLFTTVVMSKILIAKLKILLMIFPHIIPKF